MLLESALVCLPMLAFSEQTSPPLTGLICAVIGALMGAFHFLLLGLAYRIGDLSQVYPLSRGLMPVFTLAWAVLFLGERPSPLGLAGIALVVAGVYVLHLREATFKGLVDKVGVSLVDLAIYTPILYTLRPALLTPYVLHVKRELMRAEWRANKWAILMAGAGGLSRSATWWPLGSSAWSLAC